MSTICSSSEIVESVEIDYELKMNENAAKHRLKPGQVCSIEEDINKLFESMEQKRRSGLSCQASKDKLSKRAMKRPMRSVSSCSSKIGFSDSVSLKQAFRGLSISQASEMAATKRLSKPANSSRNSNFVTRGNKSLLKVTLVLEESTSKPSEKTKSFPKTNSDDRIHSILLKVDERLRSREKVESSQSSKSNSIGGCSSSTSISYESILTGHKPHMSKGLRSEVIQHFLKQNGNLSLKHFKLIKKLGGGDIGTVYLAELMGSSCLFALKFMDNDFLISRKKMLRAETEREILQMLDHPFLPSLFAHLTADKFSVLVIEYCPGGDLHMLQKKQPMQRFSEQAARFYVGEVLLALEYLHMLGVVYRDLKPENVLLREDGHIILSDFHLSLRSNVSPMLLKSSPVSNPCTKMETDQCPEPNCVHPLSLCLHPSWQVPCFTSKLLSTTARTRKQKADVATQVSPLPQLVAEPTSARSNSFIGTHEYLAPEIIRGDGHGSAVDWWALGIFLYELVYGMTPFKGPMSEDTLSNIVLRGVEFPASPTVSAHTRDLIEGLLVKDPENRLGSVRGAPEIKQHPFFEGINWALVRCTEPPELPNIVDSGNANADVAVQNYEDFTGENLGFEMF